MTTTPLTVELFLRQSAGGWIRLQARTDSGKVDYGSIGIYNCLIQAHCRLLFFSFSHCNFASLTSFSTDFMCALLLRENQRMDNSYESKQPGFTFGMVTCLCMLVVSLSARLYAQQSIKHLWELDNVLIMFGSVCIPSDVRSREFFCKILLILLSRLYVWR